MECSSKWTVVLLKTMNSNLINISNLQQTTLTKAKWQALAKESKIQKLAKHHNQLQNSSTQENHKKLQKNKHLKLMVLRKGNLKQFKQ
jgi:hypothetical protein